MTAADTVVPTLCPVEMHPAWSPSGFGFNFYWVLRLRQVWVHFWSIFVGFRDPSGVGCIKVGWLHLQPFGRSEDKGPSVRNQLPSFTPDPSLTFLLPSVLSQYVLSNNPLTGEVETKAKRSNCWYFYMICIPSTNISKNFESNDLTFSPSLGLIKLCPVCSVAGEYHFTFRTFVPLAIFNQFTASRSLHEYSAQGVANWRKGECILLSCHCFAWDCSIVPNNVSSLPLKSLYFVFAVFFAQLLRPSRRI